MTDLLLEIEAFVAFAGVPATYVGLRAVGDGNLVPEMRMGRVARPATARRVRAWMQAQRAAMVNEVCNGRV